MGRANQPRVKLWYRGNKFLIYKVFHLTHKKILRKPEKLLLPLQIPRNCVRQNIPLRVLTNSAKNDPEMEKVILLIWEVLQNYYTLESREKIETLKTIFRMPLGSPMFYCFSLIFSCFYILQQTVISISCGFLCFTTWLVYVKTLHGNSVHYAGNKQVMWKYTLL